MLPHPLLPRWLWSLIATLWLVGSLQLIVEAVPWATVLDNGPNCNNNVYPYRTCGFPTVVNITSPSHLVGSTAYMPFYTPHSLKFHGAVNLRVLIPRVGELANGWPGNVNNQYGCPIVDPSLPYQYQENGIWLYNTSDDGTPYRGAALMVLRGGCTRVFKQRAAEVLGVTLLIEVDTLDYNQQVGGIYNQPAPIVSDITYKSSIPAISLTRVDGNILWNAIKAGEIVRMQIWGSGRTTPEMKAHIAKFAAGFTYPQLIPPTQITPVPVLSPLLRHWSDAANPALDPCWDSLQGLWCENGEPVAIQWNGLSALKGTWDDISFSNFKQLSIIFINGGSLTGAFPSSWCQWPEQMKLSYVVIHAQNFLSLPDCWDRLPNLQVLHANANAKIGTIPQSLASAQRLVYLSLPAVGARNTLPSSFSGAINLQYLDISNNLISGVVPDFRANSHLTTVNLGNNFLRGTVQSPFDGLVNLTSLSLTGNQITGCLPNLLNVRELTSVDFSYNQFGCSIPKNWTSSLLQGLTSFKINNNQLINSDPETLSTPFSILKNLKQIQSLDLSNNQITVSQTYFYSLYFFIQEITSSTTQNLDLSYNNISGRFFPGQAVTISINLISVNLANNQLTHLPNDLFSVRGVTSWNFKNNRLVGTNTGSNGGTTWTPGLPTGAPIASSVRLDFSGNPLLISSSPTRSLPSFVSINTDSLSKSRNQLFSCFSISGALPNYRSLQQVYFDPEFDAYTRCSCDAGTYGIPPNCQTLPDMMDSRFTSNNISNIEQIDSAFPDTIFRQSIVSSEMTGNIITDNQYGSQRYMSGITTYWSISLNPNVTRVINFLLFINLDIFMGLNNEVRIYDGSDNLSGTVLFRLRGDMAQLLDESKQTYITYTKQATQLENNQGNQQISTRLGFNNTGLFLVQVTDASANVQFISRAVSGKHFHLEYYPSTACPRTYYIHPYTGKCIVPKAIEFVSDSVVTPIIAVAVIIAGFLVLLGILTAIYQIRGYAVIKASSPTLLYFFLLGGILLCLAIICRSLESSLYFSDTSDINTAFHTNFLSIGRLNSCLGEFWILNIGYVLFIGSLMTKTYRISKIFNSRHLSSAKNVSKDYQLIIKLMGLVIAQVILLVILTSVKTYHMTIAENNGTSSITYCTSDSKVVNDVVILITRFALLITTCIYSISIRKVPDQFNESTQLIVTCYNLACLSIGIPIVEFSMQRGTAANVIVHSSILFTIIVTTSSIVYGPKLTKVMCNNKVGALIASSTTAATMYQPTNVNVKNGHANGAGAGTSAGVRKGSTHDASGNGRDRKGSDGSTAGNVLVNGSRRASDSDTVPMGRKQSKYLSDSQGTNVVHVRRNS